MPIEIFTESKPIEMVIFKFYLEIFNDFVKIIGGGLKGCSLVTLPLKAIETKTRKYMMRFQVNY